MDITLPGFKYLGYKIDNIGQKTKRETLPKHINTPSKPLDKKSPSPSPNIGSFLPVKINTSPLEP
jgi:hypothetical protein